jgi:hypothetical protein
VVSSRLATSPLAEDKNLRSGKVADYGEGWMESGGLVQKEKEEEGEGDGEEA